MSNPSAREHPISVGRQLWAAAASASLLQPALVLAEADEARELQPVVVTGKRASLASAQEIKQEKQEIVDALVADDIHKLPDINVTDALQRVTGIQISRDRGEGSTVIIRGLTQIETTLNGREVFSAGTGRSLDFADIPAEMVSAIHVYKTSAAEHIEGGIGGLVDLRTRRPFDFKDTEVLASARYIYGDLADRGKPQYSLLASKRWQDAAFGQFGALLTLAYQERAWREDQKSSGNLLARTDLVPGQTVVAPNGTSETTSIGSRRRQAGGMVLQWLPVPSLELYAEANYAELKTLQDSYQINVTASPTFVAGSPTLFPGTSDLQSITWTNAPAAILSFARDTLDRMRQGAVGASWTAGNFTLKADLSRTLSENQLFFSGSTLATTVANFSQNLSGTVPSTQVSGTDLLDPANFKFTSIAYRKRPFEGNLTALRLDGEYQFFGGVLDTLAGGLRYARRRASNDPGLVIADTAAPGSPSAASLPGMVTANPYGDFLPGSTSIGNFLVGSLSGARDAVSFRQDFGITAPIPAAGNPLGIWNIGEDTQAAYAMARLKGKAMPIDGNVGLRVVRTREMVTGSESVPATGSIAPIAIDHAYVDVLPSANLRYDFGQGLYLRAAASKSVTRPNFDQLSPSLTLVRNSVNPALNVGSAGNPNLRPVRADNLDLALERYFARGGAVHITGFMKKVDGFTVSASGPETWYGEVYQVSRPYNANTADIEGVEIGYQQFYDFLPGWLRGLGLQANYTYVSSETFDNVLRRKVALQNLSRNSANLVFMYERGPVSARLAWNWRDKFLTRVANFAGVGAQPVYMRAYDWVDASLSYRISDKLLVAVEGLNLTRTVRRSYYGSEIRPESALMNDRQFAATLTVKF